MRWPLLIGMLIAGCHPSAGGNQYAHLEDTNVQAGASRFDMYLQDLRGKRVALVANPTTEVNGTHLVDSLLALKVQLVRIFSPEHGFRGKQDAGERIADARDAQTGLPIVSLYGSNKKPTPEQMQGVDILLFDLQDVGARFYTYISTLHYVMEASAEAGIPLIVLDRPNPNGHYVDGPVLDPAFQSFVGMHPIPVVHGLTVGELATMIRDEGWLDTERPLELRVVPCRNWDHAKPYVLPVRPSPNLPNARAIELYPSLCFYEGTPLSIGRGTPYPFQVLGHPEFDGLFTFEPRPGDGAKHPKLENEICFGYDLRVAGAAFSEKPGRLNVEWLVQSHKRWVQQSGEPFFLPNLFFDKLAGTDKLRLQLIAGESAEAIRQSWEPALGDYKDMRSRYLLYPDFE